MAVLLGWRREIPQLEIEDGNHWRILRQVLRNPSAFLLKLCCASGDIAQFAAGPVRMVLVNRPELVVELLSERAGQLRKLPAVKKLHVLTGDGLVVSESETWTKHRRLVAPAFHHRRIQQHHEMVAQIIDAAQAQWQHGQIIDLQKEFKRISLQMIGKAMFSVEPAHIAEGFADDITEALSYVNRVAAQIALPFGRHFIRGHRAGEAAIRRVQTLVDDLIRRRRAEGHDGERGDFLSMLLQSKTAEGEVLSDAEVRDEAITMFVAGHETLATVLTWLYYHVAEQPAVQQALHCEASAHLQGRLPTLADLEQLPLALQCFKEALRLYPSVFTIGRQTVEDIDLAEYVIPANMWVVVSPYSVHRKAQVFTDPDHFNPDRFAHDREKSWARGSYIPFGYGPRTCIGNSLALMEGHIIAAHLAQRVRLQRVDPQPIHIAPLITLNPERPVLMRVERV